MKRIKLNEDLDVLGHVGLIILFALPWLGFLILNARYKRKMIPGFTDLFIAASIFMLWFSHARLVNEVAYSWLVGSLSLLPLFMLFLILEEKCAGLTVKVFAIDSKISVAMSFVSVQLLFSQLILSSSVGSISCGEEWGLYIISIMVFCIVVVVKIFSTQKFRLLENFFDNLPNESMDYIPLSILFLVITFIYPLLDGDAINYVSLVRCLVG